MASRNGLPGPLQSLFEEHDETLKLTLVTSVLNASSNWFFLHLLQGSFKEKHISEPQDVVVMFSFMRSWAFWKDCALKMGVDLDQAKHKGKLWFVDGLASSLPSSKLPQASERPHLPDDRNISQAIDDLSTSIEKAGAAASNQSKLIILIDQIDGLLAASSTLRAVDIESKISTWREVSTSIFLSVAADMPLVHQPTTRLELEHTSFITSIAHQATLTLSVRPLDTGATREVSGVLRVSSGSLSDEWLYHIRKDFNIKAWGRGEHFES